VRLLSLVTLIFTLGGCAAQHQIAGSHYGWNADTTQVLEALESETLQLQQVRVEDQDCISGFRDHLEISGQFDAATLSQFSRLLNSAERCQSLGGVRYPMVVFMNGQGGTLEQGYQLGKLLKENGLHAVITGDQRCGGACAVAFLGAKHRSIRHQGKLELDALQSPKTLAEGCFSQQERTLLKRYLISVLGRTQGLKLYDLALDRCGSTNPWVINRDIARIYRLPAL
jgi:hypothetical protein